MNTYSLPEPVETTLYDVDGNRWGRQGRYWTSDYAKNNYLFGTLLSNYGPLTSEPPIKEGDMISLRQFFTLPADSVMKEKGNTPFYLDSYNCAHYSRTIIEESDLKNICIPKPDEKVFKLLQIGED